MRYTIRHTEITEMKSNISLWHRFWLWFWGLDQPESKYKIELWLRLSEPVLPSCLLLLEAIEIPFYVCEKGNNVKILAIRPFTETEYQQWFRILLPYCSGDTVVYSNVFSEGTTKP